MTYKARTDLGARDTRDTPLLHVTELGVYCAQSHDIVSNLPWRHPGGQEGLTDPELTRDPEAGNGESRLHKARHTRHLDHLDLGLAWHLVTRGYLRHLRVSLSLSRVSSPSPVLLTNVSSCWWISLYSVSS